MADTTPFHVAPQTPPSTGTSTGSRFADSAIHMDLTTSTFSPQSKPEFESDQFESELNTPSVLPVDDGSNQLPDLENLCMSIDENRFPDEAIETGRHQLDNKELTPKPSRKISSPDMHPESDVESEFKLDPEFISHFTTTVSSLRLRHQEQSHLQSLFTSKLEALAQRSLQHEATIRSLTAELKSLHDSNTDLSRESALLVQENNGLRAAMQDMKAEVTGRKVAMEAMTGAVRGLEGWIENASNSPDSSSQRRMLQDVARQKRAGRGVIRGKGRFRGRYYIDDHQSGGRNGGLGLDGSTDMEATDIQEGVMAWVRGFRDVEEGLKARNEMENRGRPRPQINGRPHGSDRSDDTTFDPNEEFGDFETV